jgi:hypothetical protein
MTDTQYLTIIGTIWVAPHVQPWYALGVGAVFLAVSILKTMGVL